MNAQEARKQTNKNLDVEVPARLEEALNAISKAVEDCLMEVIFTESRPEVREALMDLLDEEGYGVAYNDTSLEISW